MKNVRKKIGLKLVHHLLVLVFVVVDVYFYFFDLEQVEITAGLVVLLGVQLVDVVFGFGVAHVVKRCFENQGPLLVEGEFFENPDNPRKCLQLLVFNLGVGIGGRKFLLKKMEVGVLLLYEGWPACLMIPCIKIPHSIVFQQAVLETKRDPTKFWNNH